MERDLAVQLFLALCLLEIVVDARWNYPWLDDNCLLVIHTISEFPSRCIRCMMRDDSLLAQRLQVGVEVAVVIPAENDELPVSAPVQAGGLARHLDGLFRGNR